MIETTRGIVLRSVKYGESSLISSIFTRTYGVQSYMVQGIRTTRSRHNKAGLLQPAALLDLVVYQKPHGGLQRIRDMQFAHIYTRMQEDIVRNSIALFSVELLLRLLPEHAPQPELFDLATHYFVQLDRMPIEGIANFPLYFLVECGRCLGYGIRGEYSLQTPYLNLHEGAYTSAPPVIQPFVEEGAARALSLLSKLETAERSGEILMNAGMRFGLVEWYISFLQRHTQHMGAIRSLQILQMILH